MTDLETTLEAGGIAVFANTAWLVEGGDRELLREHARVARGHKNIAYDRRHGRLTGLAADSGALRSRVTAILNTYGAHLSGWLAVTLSAYATAWTPEQTTFRPFEEAGRPLPPRARNDLLHTDAFPSRPTHGARILRVFTNLHPTLPRCWVTGAPFHLLLPQLADDPRCPRPRRSGQPTRLGGLLRQAAARCGLAVASRSAYDVFMLRFHDFLKANNGYQTHGGTQRWAFEPLSTWMVFTDSVPHAVLSGQFALEQTYLVPHEALVRPDLAPLAVLEHRYGGPLVTPRHAS